MKRCCYLLLTFVLIFSCWPPEVFAIVQENDNDEVIDSVVYQECIVQSDGSVLEIRTVRSAKTANYVNGSTYILKRSNTGTVLWRATLTARFFYNGSASSCVSAVLTTQFDDSSYFEVSRNVTKEDETATANFTIGHRVLGITVGTKSYTLNLTCDMNGNIS